MDERGKMMRVRIIGTTGATGALTWYADRIGQVITVKEIGTTLYYQDVASHGLIFQQDCEPVRDGAGDDMEALKREWEASGRTLPIQYYSQGTWFKCFFEPKWDKNVNYRKHPDAILTEAGWLVKTESVPLMALSPEHCDTIRRCEDAEELNPLAVQVGGDHYKTMKIQPVEFAHANDLPFIEGSVVKYVCRHRQKHGRKDLEKAKHFIDLLIELEYNKTP